MGGSPCTILMCLPTDVFSNSVECRAATVALMGSLGTEGEEEHVVGDVFDVCALSLR